MAEAAAQGIQVVIWATMRTADVIYVGPTYASNASTFRDNNRILLAKASQYGGRLQVADWATYSASRREWVERDGIHLTPSGATAMAGFIADQAASALARISVPTRLTTYVAPAKGVGSGQVLLSWSPPSYTAGRIITDYAVQRSSDGGATWQTVADGVSRNWSYLASGLTNGQAYRFRVAAYTSAGLGRFSAAVTAAPRAAAPSAPTGVTAQVAPAGGVGSGQVLVAWNLPAYTGGRAVTDYAIQRSADGGATWRTVVDGVSRNWSYMLSGLTNGHEYLLRVAAFTSAGRSTYGAAVTAAPDDPALAAAPALVAATTATAVTTATTTTTAPATTTVVTTTTTAPAPSRFSVGDFVWVDADLDGVQDVGEPGLGGVVVRLISAEGTIVAENVSDSQGRYVLDATVPGPFMLEVVLPDDYQPTLVDVGLDDAIDSDVDPVDVVVGPIETTVRVAFDNAGEDDLDLDVGLLAVAEEPPTTDTTAEPTTTPTTLAQTTSLAPSTTLAATTTLVPTTETTAVAVPDPTDPVTVAPTTTAAVITTSGPAG